MKQRNCKNCGAPIEHTYNHQCPYCKTLYDFGIEEHKEIKPEWIRDVKFLSMDKDPLTNRYILYFEGTYCKPMQFLEFTKNNYYAEIDRECLEPKRVRFCIAISERELSEPIRFFQSIPYEIDQHEIVKIFNEIRGYY